MSKAIQDFLNDLKDWQKNFTIQEYEFEKYNCEIAQITRMQNNNDIDGLVNFWNEKVKQEYFEIKHPLYNDIVLRAVFSSNEFLLENYVFLIDKENKYPCLWLQATHCINAIVVEKRIFVIKEPWNDDVALTWTKLMMTRFAKENIINLYHRDIAFAFTLKNTRPWHFFSEKMYVIQHLDSNNKLVESTHSFFTPKQFKSIAKSKIKDFVLFYPSAIPMFIGLLKEVYAESIQDREKIVKKDNFNYDLILWLGLPGQKRAWLEQVKGVALILKNLSKYFKTIKVYVDGMTAYDGQRADFPENKVLFHKVVKATKEVFANLKYDLSLDELNNDVIKQHANLNNSSNEFCYTKDNKANLCTGGGHCESFIYDADELQGLEQERSEEFKKLSLFFNLNTINSNNDTSSNALSSNSNKNSTLIVFKSLVGYDYRSKICFCDDCDMAVSEPGTATIVPMLLCNKPNVHYYGDKRMPMSQNSKRSISEKYVLIAGSSPFFHANDFHIPPQHLYNLTAEVLEELVKDDKLKGYKNGVDGKGNKLIMHRLKVPPVELTAKQYELEQKTKIDISLENVALYTELEQKINISNTAIQDQNSNLNQQLHTLNHQLQRGKAKDRIHNHLAYKLGQALITCSKSFFAYISMPFILSYIKTQHKLSNEKYQKAIINDPSLKLPALESYPDYKEALKEKECFTYKLGSALMYADKTWYKGGYIWFYFEAKRLKAEFINKKENL